MQMVYYAWQGTSRDHSRVEDVDEFSDEATKHPSTGEHWHVHACWDGQGDRHLRQHKSEWHVELQGLSPAEITMQAQNLKTNTKKRVTKMLG